MDLYPIFIDVLAKFGDEFIGDINLAFRCRRVDVDTFGNALPAGPDRVVTKVDVKQRDIVVLYPLFFGKEPLFVTEPIFIEGDRAKCVGVASHYKKSDY